MKKELIESGNYKEIDFEFYKTSETNKILIIGSGGTPERQKGVNVNLANILGPYNFSIINFDIQNNNYIDSVNKMAEKFHRMIEYAGSNGFKIDDMGIVGRSSSGLPAVIASTEYSNMKVLLKYPVIYYQDMLEKTIGKFFLIIWKYWGEISRYGCRAPYSLYSEWRDSNLDALAKRLKTKSNKLHIVHGDKDKIIPWFYSKSFYKLLNKYGVNSKLTILKGAGHDLDGRKNLNKVAEIIIDHFK
ncbi:MAG: alpha/beta hydrolase family protein [Candidatus Scalindua sp.]